MSTQIVDIITNAIVRQENVTPTINNPGGLMDVPYYRQTGLFRLATYSTIDEGTEALKRTVATYVNKGVTLEDMFSAYAPKGHGSNDPVVYANNVSGWTGIPLGVPLNQVQLNDGRGKGEGGGDTLSTILSPSIPDTTDTNDPSNVVVPLVVGIATIAAVVAIFS